MNGKFKVWCKNTNGWETHQCFLSEDGELCHRTHSGLMRLKPETHIPVFYTGRKDKNGKEIYWGDIVKQSCGNPAEGKTGTIIWHDEKAGFQIDGIPMCFNNPYLDIEIIGNKFKNPNLMEP